MKECVQRMMCYPFPIFYSLLCFHLTKICSLLRCDTLTFPYDIEIHYGSEYYPLSVNKIMKCIAYGKLYDIHGRILAT